MREWDVDRVAGAAGARVVRRPGEGAGTPGPTGVSIDSRRVETGDLFVGLAGEKEDGGRYAGEALERGAWGVLVTPEHAKAAGEGVALACEDPLKAMQGLAREWARELKGEGMKIVGVTGSTGKTSTKDILSALLAPHLRTVASPENQNTEIGLPLAILGTPKGTEALVLEMAMRGRGQIAELAEIAEPNVGVIVNVGPVHLEQLGSREGVARAKAELIEGLKEGATAVVPADEPLLEPYRREDVRTVTFGPGGDVAVSGRRRVGDVGGAGEAEDVGDVAGEGAVEVMVVDRSGEQPVEIALRVGFEQEHQLRNLEAAVAAARAVGVTPEGEVRVRFSRMRGQRRELPGGVEVIEDCYNANPMSMRAAIDYLVNVRQKRARTHTHARAVAVLGDMLELGADEERYHREIGEYARTRGVDVLVTVGERARAMAGPFAAPAERRSTVGRGLDLDTPARAPDLMTVAREVHSVPDAQAAGELLRRAVAPGDTVLVKGSRGVGLERAIEVLRAQSPVAAGVGIPAAGAPSAMAQTGGA